MTYRRHRSRADGGVEQRGVGPEEDRVDLEDQFVDLVDQECGQASPAGQPEVLARPGLLCGAQAACQTRADGMEIFNPSASGWVLARAGADRRHRQDGELYAADKGAFRTWQDQHRISPAAGSGREHAVRGAPGGPCRGGLAKGRHGHDHR